MVEATLGLVPEAFEGRLRIEQPTLPDFLHYLEIRRLRVGGARVDLRFEQTANGVAVRILNIQGDLDVVVRLKPR